MQTKPTVQRRPEGERANACTRQSSNKNHAQIEHAVKHDTTPGTETQKALFILLSHSISPYISHFMFYVWGWSYDSPLMAGPPKHDSTNNVPPLTALTPYSHPATPGGGRVHQHQGSVSQGNTGGHRSVGTRCWSDTPPPLPLCLSPAHPFPRPYPRKPVDGRRQRVFTK